jgi:Arc/MetJ family transcription regulator
MARNTSNRRSSALLICSPPGPDPFYGDQQGQRLGTRFAWRIGRLRLASDHGEAIATRDKSKDFGQVIFKGVIDGKPYPNHGLTHRQWSQIPPRQIRLDELVTTTTVLQLDRLLSEDSTFYGDLFPHAVRWRGVIYLEDGLHRAVRAALRNRTVLHARVFDMDAPVARQM